MPSTDVQWQDDEGGIPVLHTGDQGQTDLDRGELDTATSRASDRRRTMTRRRIRHAGRKAVGPMGKGTPRTHDDADEKNTCYDETIH